MNDSPTPHVRFSCCALTTASNVFTQLGGIADMAGLATGSTRSRMTAESGSKFRALARQRLAAATGRRPTQADGDKPHPPSAWRSAGCRRGSGDVDELGRHADAFGAALLVDHAGNVGRHDALGTDPRMIAHLVVAHLGRNDLCMLAALHNLTLIAATG
jgi:hypothetical protein